MTQRLFSTCTISRSNRTVVVSVSCESTGPHQIIAIVAARMAAIARNFVFTSELLHGFADTKRESKRMDLVVPPELCPGAVHARFRHQTLERDVRSSAQFFQIRSRWNQKAWKAV